MDREMIEVISLCKPVIEFLKSKYGWSYTKVTITAEGITLNKMVMRIPTTLFPKDISIED